jgi:hypothetical protein
MSFAGIGSHCAPNSGTANTSAVAARRIQPRSRDNAHLIAGTETGTTTMIRSALRILNCHRGGTERAHGFLAMMLAVLAAGPVMAQGTDSFTLKFSEKEMKLENPTDMMWDKYLMWDLAFQRMNDRNMPYLELLNDPNSTSPIKELHLTIGDTRFNFSDDVMGKFAMLGHTTPGFNITSSTVGNLGNELIVNIGGPGLLPGELLRFKIDLAVDPEFADAFFAHPDYRTVLFDMNGFNVYDGLQQQNDADNAKAWVIFDPAVGADFSTVPVPLEDELVTGAAADFYNNNYRRYGESDPVRTFLLVGGGEAVIPEPGSLLLTCVAAFSLAWSSARHRRSSRT